MAKRSPAEEARKAETDNLVKRMFIATGDPTYLTARIAFFHQIDVEFCWLAMHSVEKYLKATCPKNVSSGWDGLFSSELHHRVNP